jgi:hypothetical protein
MSRLRRAARAFPILISVWIDDLRIDPTTLRKWPDFEVLRDLRHVVVHRLGAWEPGLDPKPRLEARIRRLSMSPNLYRGPVPLDRSDVEKAVELAITIVDELDRL